MLWFKHDSDASNDAKLRKLRIKYGAQGYGIFWYCLELIARNVDKNNLTFELEHDAELIAEDFKLSSELVQEMMTYMVNLGLFENTNGMITCLKMSTRTDEYTQKLINRNKKCPDTIPTLSGENPRISVLIEEKRREEIYTPRALLEVEGIPKSLINDWLKVRKEKKQPLTPTALEATKREAAKANLTLTEVIQKCCENSWAGFKASYIKNDSVLEPDWKKDML